MFKFVCKSFCQCYLIVALSPIMGKFSNMGRCIIPYQEVLRSELKNVIIKQTRFLLNHIVNGQLLKSSVRNFCLSFGAL